MKILILKENLKKALHSIERSIGENVNLPILKNIFLKTENNKLIASATNLELATSHAISGKIIENGGVTIPLQMFSGLINNLASERINLEKNGHNLIVKTDNYEAVIQGMNTEDYPLIPKIKDASRSITIKADIFTDAVSKVISAAQFLEINPEISSMLFTYGVDHIKLTATDSFRLAEKTIPSNLFKSSITKGFRVIIPLKTAKEILKVFEEEDNLEIVFDENQVVFKTPDIELVSRLIDGNYPQYESIIPKEISTELVVEKNELINALKLANVFTSKINDVKLRVDESKKNIEIYSADSGIGENRYLVPAKIKGEPVQIAFNLRYLQDGLKSITSDEIIFGINSDNKPSVIKAPHDTSFFYIVMPIRS